MNTEELKKALLDKGIDLTGSESFQELKKMHKVASETLSDEEIAKQETELKEQMQLAKSGSVNNVEELKNGEKMIPLSQVEEMMRKFGEKLENKLSKKDSDVDELIPEKFTTPQVRVPRIEVLNEDGTKSNHFVIGFKNMNTQDEYDNSVKEVVELVKKENGIVTRAPWVTLLLDNGSEKMYPLLSFMDNARGIPFDLIETKLEDLSYSEGKTEKMDIGEDGYSTKSTGVFVNMKVDKKKPTFCVKHPETGKTLEVSQSVINIIQDKSSRN